MMVMIVAGKMDGYRVMAGRTSIEWNETRYLSLRNMKAVNVDVILRC